MVKLMEVHKEALVHVCLLYVLEKKNEVSMSSSGFMHGVHRFVM